MTAMRQQRTIAPDVEIRTARLTLRPWRPEDIEALILGLDDLEVARWLAFVPHPYTRPDAERWIDRCRAIATASGRPVAYEFAIEHGPERSPIGGVSLNKIDWDSRTGGGGIWIAKAYQGRGFGREAFQAKIDFAFGDLGLMSLVNGYFEGNEASWAMQRTLGYRPVAAIPARCMADGRQTVEHVTRLLRDDWDARRPPTETAPKPER